MAPMTYENQERPMSLAQRAASHLDCFRILHLLPFYLFFFAKMRQKISFCCKKKSAFMTGLLVPLWSWSLLNQSSQLGGAEAFPMAMSLQ